MIEVTAKLDLLKHLAYCTYR